VIQSSGPEGRNTIIRMHSKGKRPSWGREKPSKETWIIAAVLDLSTLTTECTTERHKDACEVLALH
jgi:hypothetical protein